MKKYNFLAFDIGATSGRSILATIDNGKLTLKELTRYPNNIIRIGDKYHWEIFALYSALKEGLKAAAAENVKIDGIGIDTWGVDFVYIGEDGSILGLPRSYRDPYTNGMPEDYFENVISRKEVYDLTGIQIMNFNSLFQLHAAKKENSSALKAAKSILFMPDALSYLLTGKKVCEYSIASTSQMLNPKTKKIENKLLEAIGIDPSIIEPIIMPGEKIGTLTESLARECGLDKDIPVIAVAGHDTGSAVAAVPAENEKFAYLSSGTWSLMGIEVRDAIINDETFALNFTNEGGVEGTTRFLKNITGMWLLEQCRKEWSNAGKTYTYPEIVTMASSTEKNLIIEPDDASFANPESMTAAITAYCKKTGQDVPECDADYIRCIFYSLALKYKYVMDYLQKLAPYQIEKLHVIGGGSQNKLLNQLTANSTGVPVVAGPSEATAIGNVMLQAKGVSVVSTLDEMRAIIRNSVELDVFEPKDAEKWSNLYKEFLAITKLS